MAYNLIYTVPFTDQEGLTGCTYIYKESYAGASTELTGLGTKITYNPDSNIIGTGAEVQILNDFNDWTTMDDLLGNYEKQYKAKIIKNGINIFEGFLVCDINEQGFSYRPPIILNFTNYLKRLEDIEYVTGGTKSLLEIIEGILALTGLDYDLYVNTSLYHSGSTNNKMWNIGVDTQLFYRNNEETLSAYKILQEILKTFNSYLYMYKGAWYIERMDDVNSSGNWVKFTGSATPIGVSNQKAIYNKQDDFEYLDNTQRLIYNSGVNDLNVKLDDKVYDTLVINYWNNATTANTYNVNPQPYNWIIHQDQINTASPYRGVKYNYLGIARAYGLYSNDNWFYDTTGMYTTFKMSFNTVQNTTLNLKWKMNSLETDRLHSHPEYLYKIYINYFIKQKDTNNYLKYNTATSVWEFHTGFHRITDEYRESSLESGTKVLQHSKTIDLTPLSGSCAQDQEWVIGFLNSGYDYSDGVTIATGSLGSSSVPLEWSEGWTFVYTYIGDIIISVNGDTIDNDYNATINEDFIKKESQTLMMFDTPSFNYKNSMYYTRSTAFDTKTSMWTTDGSNYYNIAKIYIMSKIRQLLQTTKGLEATIYCDEILLKPFALITDDNISGINFLLQSYSYDVENNEYNIKTRQYVEETINLI